MGSRAEEGGDSRNMWEVPTFYEMFINKGGGHNAVFVRHFR